MQFFGDLPHEKEMAEAMQEFEESQVSACCGAQLNDFGICEACLDHSDTFYGMPWFMNAKGQNPLQEFNKIMEVTFPKA